jgi:hypothetical protein
MAGGYQQAIRENLPQAEIAFDPFHVVRLAQRAVDLVRRGEWNAHDRSHTTTAKWIKGTRWSLLKAPEKQHRLAGTIVGSRASVGVQRDDCFRYMDALMLGDCIGDDAVVPISFDLSDDALSSSRVEPAVPTHKSTVPLGRLDFGSSLKVRPEGSVAMPPGWVRGP